MSSQLLFGASDGPEVALFKRFQKQWPYINQTEYSQAKDDLFVGDMEILRKEMLSFYSGAVGHQQPREDYLELLRLCLIFLGEAVTGWTSSFELQERCTMLAGWLRPSML